MHDMSSPGLHPFCQCASPSGLPKYVLFTEARQRQRGRVTIDGEIERWGKTKRKREGKTEREKKIVSEERSRFLGFLICKKRKERERTCH